MTDETTDTAPTSFCVDTEVPHPRLLDVIGHLYEAASDLARWEHFLRAACRLFDARYSNLVHYDAAHPSLSISLATGFEHIPEETKRWAAAKQLELRDEDPRIVYSRDHPYKPVTCTEILPHEELRATRVYRELLSVAGIEWSLMVQYSDEADKFTGVSFHRGPDQAPFTPRETALLGELLPHLRRAFVIQQKLIAVDHQLQASYQVLETLPAGIAVVDEDGRVEFANRAARDLCALDDGIALREGEIQWLHLPAEAWLATLRAVGESGEHRAISAVRRSARRPFQCLVARLSQAEPAGQPNLLARPRVSLFMTDPEQALETSEQLLQRMFGLTPAEARVLERLVAGLAPEEIAHANEVGLATVRSQIKSIHAKTGCSNQAELIRRVLTSPIWVAQRKAN